MLRTFTNRDGRIEVDMSPSPAVLAGAVWVDLLSPTPEEERAVEELLHLDVPTAEEMREVESSSNLYREKDAAFITVRLLNRPKDEHPNLAAVTMIVTRQKLVTLRYADPTPFKLFCARVERSPELVATPLDTVVGFLETVVDRAADILEEIGTSLDQISGDLFTQNATSTSKMVEADLAAMLRRIGRNGDLAGRARESLLSLTRAASFISAGMNGEQETSEAMSPRLHTLRRDVQSLLEHDSYLLSQIQFLLDSNLGMISIQQNAIIKILSVAAVIFLPPTLVGSLYGMNFVHMPELQWHLGYPMAVGMMVLSAVLPYWYFRRKGWL